MLYLMAPPEEPDGTGSGAAGDAFHFLRSQAACPLTGESEGMSVVLMLDPNDRKAGDSLEVCNVECCDTIADMQCRRANEQVLEGNRDAMRGLFTLDATGKLGNLDAHRMDHKVASEFFYECSSPVTLGIASRSVNAVRQLNNSYNRESTINFSVRGTDSFEGFADGVPATLTGDEHAGV